MTQLLGGVFQILQLTASQGLGSPAAVSNERLAGGRHVRSVAVTVRPRGGLGATSRAGQWAGPFAWTVRADFVCPRPEAGSAELGVDPSVSGRETWALS